MHLGAFAMSRPEILQSRSGLRGDQLPPIKNGVVGTDGRARVVCFTLIADDSIFVQNLRTFRQSNGTPVSLAFAILLRHRGELPIAEEIVKIPLVRIVGRLDLLWCPLNPRLRCGVNNENNAEGENRVSHDAKVASTFLRRQGFRSKRRLACSRRSV